MDFNDLERSKFGSGFQGEKKTKQHTCGLEISSYHMFLPSLGVISAPWRLALPLPVISYQQRQLRDAERGETGVERQEEGGRDRWIEIQPPTMKNPSKHSWIQTVDWIDRHPPPRDSIDRIIAKLS